MKIESEKMRGERREGRRKKGGPGRNGRYSKKYAAADREDKLIINLRDLGHTMRALYEGRGSQKQILMVLNEVKRITQRDLTAELRIQPGSASEVIRKLEKSELIKRVQSETDRRTTDITLTEAGRLKAEEALKMRRNRHKDMFSCLTEEEKDTLLTLMEKLNGDWDVRFRSL